MIENISKVLVVDNEERELESISKVLNELKIPAYYSLYSIANPPKVPFKGIRLAFFDINLQVGNPDVKQAANTFANALKQHIDIDNGPYILIYWTSHIGLVKRILDFINERESEHIAPPILVKEIDKTVFSTAKKLSKEIDSILSNNIIELLFDYENKVTHAAGKTLKTIFNVVSNGNDKWGESKIFEKNLDPVLSTIAFEAVGIDTARKNKPFAIKKGLEPILLNEIQKIEISNKWEKNVSTLKKRKNEIKFPLDINSGLVNNLFHIEIIEDKKDKLTRGNIVELNLSEEGYREVFGYSKNGLLKKFLKNIENLNNTKFVLLEISAGCDFIQNKERLFKYILGIYSEEIEKGSYWLNSDSLYFLPVFYLEKKDIKIVLNFHFLLGLTRNSKLLGTPILRIKPDLLNQISINNSRYLSRPGIIQFH